MRSIHHSLIFFFFIAGVIASAVTSCSLCTEINPEDIPIYTNAQDIKQEEPILGGIEIYKWSFTTTDKPEKVWQFYKEKMVDEWNGSDHSAPQSNEKDVMIKGCFFYYFKLNNTSSDNKTYNFTVEFSKEPYR